MKGLTTSAFWIAQLRALNFMGPLHSLSLVKKGRNSIFFDGVLANEKSKIWFVGFDAHQQRRLHEYHQRNVQIDVEERDWY